MKKVICVILVIMFVMTLCGCRKAGEDFTENGRFAIVSGDSSNAPYNETIIVDKNTGVLYLVIYKYNHGGITPLLDSDGKPLLWEED